MAGVLGVGEGTNWGLQGLGGGLDAQQRFPEAAALRISPLPHTKPTCVQGLGWTGCGSKEGICLE